MNVVNMEDYLDPERKPTDRASRKALARRSRKQARKSTPAVSSGPTPATTYRGPLVPRSDRQRQLMQQLVDFEQVFAVGPAGTGKTYVLARHAIRQVLDGKKSVLVIARPAVAKAKHRLGFRPGKQDDKVADWLVPILDAFKDECSAGTIDKLKATGKLQFVAFETLRGRTFRDAEIILDEAQNCDLGDLRLFLTRVGEGSQVIVNGDYDQTDIDDSGLETVVGLIGRYNLSAVVTAFEEGDVVRSKFAKEWVAAFNRHKESHSA